MKVPAIVLAVVLSAASMWGQAMVGYAGASASSATAAAGSASKIGDSGMGTVQRRVSAATGGSAAESRTHSTSQSTRQSTQQRVQTTAHAEMHGAPAGGSMSAEGKMANEMGFCKQGNCPHEKEGAAKDEAGKDAAGKDVVAQQTTQKQEMKITFVGAKAK